MINPVELSYLHWQTEEEAEIQRTIIKAREYHDGEHFVYLTDRLREFLNVDDDTQFNMNIVRGIVEAITEKLIVKSFKCADQLSADFAWQVWTANKMDAKQVDVHDMTCRDRESFLFVDYNPANNSISLIPHQRYTDATVCDGDNEGCKAFYQNDDINQPLLRVSKRWVEHLDGGKTRLRMTIYYPDRIEKYNMVGGVFVPIDQSIMEAEGDTVWPVPWVDVFKQPLGIPVVHFINHGYRQEARDAWPLQDAVNKTLIDLVMSADSTAFRVYFASGWIPTTDGKPVDATGSNLLSVAPGQFLGTANKDGTLEAIEGASAEPLINMLQQLIYYAAIVTRTPVSRFQFSGMVAAEGTLKQQNESLLAKVKLRQSLFGDSWARALSIARKLWNTFSAGGLDEAQAITTLWENPEPRDRMQELQALQIEKDTLQIPLPMLWRKAGYTDQDIVQMMQDREDELTMNLRVASNDFSMPLVSDESVNEDVQVAG